MITGGWMERKERERCPAPSDLLFEGSLCGAGGGVSSSRLDRLVGHDARGELLLGLLEAGAGGTIHGMDLVKTGGWKKAKTDEIRWNQLLQTRQGKLIVGTFLNMMRDKTARAVKRPATRIIMTPTGMLLFRPIKAEIQPLKTRTS